MAQTPAHRPPSPCPHTALSPSTGSMALSTHPSPPAWLSPADLHGEFCAGPSVYLKEELSPTKGPTSNGTVGSCAVQIDGGQRGRMNMATAWPQSPFYSQVAPWLWVCTSPGLMASTRQLTCFSKAQALALRSWSTYFLKHKSHLLRGASDPRRAGEVHPQ